MHQFQKAMIWVLVAFQVASVSGCTSARTVVGPASGLTPLAISENVKVGDQLDLFLQDAARLKMKVTAISQSSVTGVDSSGEVHEVPISSIEGLTNKRVSLGKTAALAGGIWVFVSLLAAAAAGPFLM